MMMRVLGDRVLVALPPSESERESTTGFDYRTVDTTASGIILAHRADSYDEEASTRGIVMQVGEKVNVCDLDDARADIHTYFLGLAGRLSHERDIDIVRDEVDRHLMQLAPAPFDVQVGDCVVFPPSAGSPFTHDGIHYVILREDELLAVLEPQKADAA